MTYHCFYLRYLWRESIYPTPTLIIDKNIFRNQIIHISRAQKVYTKSLLNSLSLLIDIILLYQEFDPIDMNYDEFS